MNDNILDDIGIPKQTIWSKPNTKLAWGFFIAGVIVLGSKVNSSETELVKWSYLFIPLLITGLAVGRTNFFKAIVIGLISVFLVWVFYQTLWNIF